MTNPPVVSYNPFSDTLTINGRRYEAGIFDQRGFLAPVGSIFRIAEGEDDSLVYLKRFTPDEASDTLSQEEAIVAAEIEGELQSLRAQRTTLRAERRVLAGWIREALGVICDIDADAEDGGEALRLFRERGESLVAAVLAPQEPPAPGTPACNLNTPWVAP